MHRGRHAFTSIDMNAEGEACMHSYREERRWKDRHAKKRTGTHSEDRQAYSQRTRKKTNSETGRQ
jgi:hypothetical protein